MPDGSASARRFRPSSCTVRSEGCDLATSAVMRWRDLRLPSLRCRCRWPSPWPQDVRTERGLYAAIVGGFVVSALGGSRFQVGGPAGAFIVLVAAAVGKYGVDGLLLAVTMSGLFLTVIGLSGLGALIASPQAVTAENSAFERAG